MPLRVIKTCLSSKELVTGSTAIAALISDIAELSQFPPARAAALTILVILQTVVEIDNNKEACVRLARRAAKILLDIRVHMEGRWDSAPKALIHNISKYESTLVTIRDFMLSLTKIKWIGRLIQKGNIEESLRDFNELLNDAENSFQTASLIEIHYTVGILRERNEGRKVTFVENTPEDNTKSSNHTAALSHPASTSTKLIPAPDTHAEMIKLDVVATRTDTTSDTQISEELAELDRFGFKRYHQSDIQLSSELKNKGLGSFWDQTYVGDIGGRKAVIKHYDSELRGQKKWLHDIKALKSLYHPNLPQLFGFSNESSQIPFILLSHVKLRDPGSHIMTVLKRESIADCAFTLLEMYRDIASAVAYVQRQLEYSETDAQVFVDDASYSYDISAKKIIVGLPPPQEENCYRGYGYTLVESLLGKTLKILPKESDVRSEKDSNNAEIAHMQNKLAHAKAVACNLLPGPDNHSVASELLESLLEDSDDVSCNTEHLLLHDLRTKAIDAGIHENSWTAALHSVEYTFEVGDIGYISSDCEHYSITDDSRFHKFVKIGNVFEGSNNKDELTIVREVSGSQSQWVNGFRKVDDIWPFPLPSDTEGWPVCLPARSEVHVHVRHSARIGSISEAWRFLMREAQEIANSNDVDPQDIILVTKAVSGQIYKFIDHSPAATYIPPSFGRQGSMGYNQFNQFSHPHQAQFIPPQLLYLFTSHKKSFNTYWADNPTAGPTSSPPYSMSKVISLSTAWGKPEMFIGYIQLSNEDFPFI